MIVGIRDAAKLIGISIIACCAVFICTLFLNFTIDITSIKEEILSEQAMLFYHAQVATGKVVSTVSGGCLLITSVITLIFYIKHYIDTHKKELGILKALGYSNLKIAKSFWVFGISVFIGAGIGYSASFALMPTFYRIQNEDKILPDFPVHFHPSLAFFLVVLPTICFSILAVFYAYRKLKIPVLELLKEKTRTINKIKKQKKSRELPFLQQLKRDTVKSRKVLIFFIIFASFCYSAMTQMSFSMNELASVMSSIMIILIGIILACTTLFLAITTVMRSHTKTIATMRVFGYRQRECSKALLDGYRPFAYVGFAIGTIYQYVLLKIMVSVVFKDIANIPEYNFDLQALFISLVSFVFLYELTMYYYSKKINKISIKEIMLE